MASPGGEHGAARSDEAAGVSYPAVVLALLVVNPHATATTAAGRDVLAHALASDVKLEVLETSYRGHAADAAAQAAADGFDLVVAHGGDGTVNEVVNGILGDCGGCCSCATCHVYVDPQWQGAVGAGDDLETSTLEMAEDAVQQGSRLCCQITLRPELNGLRVSVVPSV